MFSKYNLKSTVYYRISEEHVSSKNNVESLNAKAQANILYELYLSELFRTYSEEYPNMDCSKIIERGVNRYNKILPLKYRLLVSKNLICIAKKCKDIKNILKIIFGKQ